MNDIIGKDSRVPSKLVFGINPRFTRPSTNLSNQKERMNALAKARMEMNSIISERPVASAFTWDIPQHADKVYELEDEVLVFSEDKLWVGPYDVVHVLGRMVTLQSKNGQKRQTFNKFQVKPFHRSFVDVFLHNTRRFTKYPLQH